MQQPPAKPKSKYGYFFQMCYPEITVFFVMASLVSNAIINKKYDSIKSMEYKPLSVPQETTADTKIFDSVSRKMALPLYCQGKMTSVRLNDSVFSHR
jgi:hypothetical protein